MDKACSLWEQTCEERGPVCCMTTTRWLCPWLGYQSQPRSSQSSASSSVTSSVAAAVSSTPASKPKRTTLEKIRNVGNSLRQTLPSTMVRRKRDGGRPMSPFHLLRKRLRTISSCHLEKSQICERNIQVL